MCLKPYKKHASNRQRRTISSHSGRRKGRRIRCYQYIVPLGQRNLRNKVNPEVGNHLVADSFNKSNLRAELVRPLEGGFLCASFKIQNSKFKIPSAFYLCLCPDRDNISVTSASTTSSFVPNGTTYSLIQ